MSNAVYFLLNLLYKIYDNKAVEDMRITCCNSKLDTPPKYLKEDGTNGQKITQAKM